VLFQQIRDATGTRYRRHNPTTVPSSRTRKRYRSPIVVSRTSRRPSRSLASSIADRRRDSPGLYSVRRGSSCRSPSGYGWSGSRRCSRPRHCCFSAVALFSGHCRGVGMAQLEQGQMPVVSVSIPVWLWLAALSVAGGRVLVGWWSGWRRDPSPTTRSGTGPGRWSSITQTLLTVPCHRVRMSRLERGEPWRGPCGP